MGGVVTGILGMGQVYVTGDVSTVVISGNPIVFTATGPITGTISIGGGLQGLQINTGGTFQYEFSVVASQTPATQNFIEISVDGLPVGTPNIWSSMPGISGDPIAVVGNGIFQLSAGEVPASIRLFYSSPGELFFPEGIGASLSVYQLST